MQIPPFEGSLHIFGSHFLCKHHCRVLFVIKLSFEFRKKISEILKNAFWGKKSFTGIFFTSSYDLIMVVPFTFW